MAVARDSTDLHARAARTSTGAGLPSSNVAVAFTLCHGMVDLSTRNGEKRRAAHVCIHIRFHGVIDFSFQVPQVLSAGVGVIADQSVATVVEDVRERWKDNSSATRQ